MHPMLSYEVQKPGFGVARETVEAIREMHLVRNAGVAQRFSGGRGVLFCACACPKKKGGEMNRRNFMNRSSAVIGTLMVPSALVQWADENRKIICHVIRLKLSPKLSPSERAQIVATIHRFKQINSPSKLIVGKDIAQPGTSTYDYTQISLFGNEDAYYSYFYDPIHLAADREAATMEFDRASSFDTLQGGDEALSNRLEKIQVERDAKFKAKDTRPASPPAPDRPEDQLWSERSTIYRMVRFDLSALSQERKAQQLAAMERCREIKGTQVMIVGRNFARNPRDHNTHAMLIALESEDVYRRYLEHPIRQAAEGIGGQIAPDKVLWFDVVDPNDTGLSARLTQLHSR
jgi:hypothetical protein